METLLFYVFGVVALVAAINVVMLRRVMYSAISLIVCLSALSGIYMLLEAQFIAAVQVIVYAGAIMVLFLFVIMLLDPYSGKLHQDKRKYLGYVAVLLGSVSFGLLFPVLASYNLTSAPRNPETVAGGIGSVKSIGESLFREYPLPFEVTSLLILVAIIGVVVLAKRQA